MSSITVKLTNVDGRVDQGAALAAFEAALASHIAETETELASVASSVLAVLAENPGKSIKLATLGSYAAMKLNATPENHATLSELAQDYVRANKGEGGLFQIVKGAGGGVKMASDQS